MYDIDWTKQAEKDSKKILRAGLKDKVKEIQRVVRRDPYEPTPGHRFEKLTDRMKNKYSRRITGFHRYIYEILENDEKREDKSGTPYEGIVRVLRMWAHEYKNRRRKR
jgi:Txe/YoeB family toxin of toxin-antitoxin system